MKFNIYYNYINDLDLFGDIVEAELCSYKPIYDIIEEESNQMFKCK